MAYIVGTAKAFPPHYCSQEALSAELRSAWIEKGLDVAIFDRLQKNVAVQGRYLALPIEDYHRFEGFADSNDAWIKTALNLGETVIKDLLSEVNLSPKDISLLMSTTVTGIAVPSIEARLMNRLDFPRNLKRVPLFGLGCLAGAAGVARVFDYLKGHPEEAAILLSVELCSLTIQRSDLSIANIISSGLFGDGAAGVLMVGKKHPLAKAPHPQVLSSESVFFPDSERVMGWDVGGDGLKIVLSPGVPRYAREELKPAIEGFLAKHELRIDQIDHWIAHPGGPKVITAMEEGLGLKENALSLSKESLQKIGNLSSSSILIILKETLKRRKPKSGSLGVMISMGPAFSAEAVLLQW